MEYPKLRKKVEELNAARADLKGFFEEATDPESGELDASRLKSYNLPDGVAIREHVLAEDKRINSLKTEVEELKAEKRLAEFAHGDPEAIEAGGGPGAPDGARRVESFGKAFVASDAYKARSGSVGPQTTLDIDPRNTLFERTAGWSPESTRTGYVDLSPEPRLSVIDVVPIIPTSQSSVKFMRETTFDDSAVAEKAEGTAFGEAALELTEQDLPVQKIPVFLPITDEQLEDEEQAAAYVDRRLVYMVRKRLNTQILQGTGVAPLLEGTENVTGIQTQAVGSDPIPDAIYKLFVKIMDDSENSGGDADPTAVFIRPAKWQVVALMRTADGIYIWGHPSTEGPESIWGVRRVLTNAVTSTKAVAGDYAMHSYFALKRGVDVQVSNSHDDFFVKGKQAIRADLRGAMVHLRPAAFGEVTGL